MSKPYVYLVGSGPGDEDLITLKGLRSIEIADVILYDRLANKELLKYKKKDAVSIDVGKSPDHHQYSQDEINNLIVEHAAKGKIVTRLKGGDPLVFGRGGEEALALYEAGIPFEIVPGVTSSIAVPSYGGIPVTHRGISTSFHVITGHEDPNKEGSDVDYQALAKVKGTLVFLMGVSNLEEITNQLISFGKSKDTPIALVHRGTTARQRTVVSTMENIVDVVRENKITSPSVIVIGDVVDLREKLCWYEKLPLFGKKILVTRTREQASGLSSQLKLLGAEVSEFPTIEIVPPKDFTDIDTCLAALDLYDFLIFTSVNGVKAFFERLINLKIDIRNIGRCKIIAIGPITTKALEDRGLVVDMMPDVYTAEGIIENLQGRIKKGQRVLLPRADIAREALVTSLENMGAEVKNLEIYHTGVAQGQREELMEILMEGIDIITFTSSSTVKNFIDILGPENINIAKKSKIAAIGPITAHTADSLGLSAKIKAQDYTVQGLIDAIVEGI